VINDHWSTSIYSPKALKRKTRVTGHAYSLACSDGIHREIDFMSSKSSKLIKCCPDFFFFDKCHRKSVYLVNCHSQFINLFQMQYFLYWANTYWKSLPSDLILIPLLSGADPPYTGGQLLFSGFWKIVLFGNAFGNLPSWIVWLILLRKKYLILCIMK
jgi:hypothetical protein